MSKEIDNISNVLFSQVQQHSWNSSSFLFHENHSYLSSSSSPITCSCCILLLDEVSEVGKAVIMSSVKKNDMHMIFKINHQ